MRLVLYSGGDGEDNETLDLEMLRLLGTTKPRITFIPSSYDTADEYFDEFVQHYRPHGFENFQIFHVDQPHTDYDAHTALDSDMIFLSGGNTFYFLHHLRKARFLNHLRRFCYSDGVLAGLSAGAIMMTPNINMAAVPYFDRDENNVGIRNLKALNLMPFEFFPHYEDQKSYEKELSAYTQQTARPLYAAGDGSGIVVNFNRISFVGDIWGYVRGQKFIISQD